MSIGRTPAPPATPEQVERIKRAQKALGLSKRRLALLVGCTPAAATYWFQGKLTQPRAEQIEAALVDFATEMQFTAQTTYRMVHKILDWDAPGQPTRKAMSHG